MRRALGFAFLIAALVSVVPVVGYSVDGHFWALPVWFAAVTSCLALVMRRADSEQAAGIETGHNKQSHHKH